MSSVQLLTCIQLFATPWSPWNSPSQNTGVGSLSLLRGIFPTQGLNPGLPHCRQMLYCLSHLGSLNAKNMSSNPWSGNRYSTHFMAPEPMYHDS